MKCLSLILLKIKKYGKRPSDCQLDHLNGDSCHRASLKVKLPWLSKAISREPTHWAAARVGLGGPAVSRARAPVPPAPPAGHAGPVTQEGPARHTPPGPARAPTRGEHRPTGSRLAAPAPGARAVASPGHPGPGLGAAGLGRGRSPPAGLPGRGSLARSLLGPEPPLARGPGGEAEGREARRDGTVCLRRGDSANRSAPGLWRVEAGRGSPAGVGVRAGPVCPVRPVRGAGAGPAWASAAGDMQTCGSGPGPAGREVLRGDPQPVRRGPTGRAEPAPQGLGRRPGRQAKSLDTASTKLGADMRMPMVQRMVKTEKAIRHRRSTTQAANFHSLRAASASSWPRKRRAM